MQDHYMGSLRRNQCWLKQVEDTTEKSDLDPREAFYNALVTQF